MKASDENKMLIAALKRSATRKLRYCHRESPSAKASAAQNFRHSKPQSLQMHAHGLRILWMTFPGVLEMSLLPHSIQAATIGEEIFYVIPCR